VRPIWQGQGLRFSGKSEHLRLISCLLCGFLHMLLFCGPVIGPWALREKNALELANRRACYIVYQLTNTSHIIVFICSVPDLKKVFFFPD